VQQTTVIVVLSYNTRDFAAQDFEWHGIEMAILFREMRTTLV